LNSLKLAILTPFKEFIRVANPLPAAANAPNAYANKVALMAHLLVHPDAVPLWTMFADGVPAENRPAGLDQMVRPRDQILAELVALSEELKQQMGSFDMEPLSANNIGVEAAMECATLRPYDASFVNGAELLEIRTKYVNFVDIKVANIDHSGSNLASGQGIEGYQRRLQAWDSFFGTSGRNKSVDVFYCFVLWEGKEVRWATRRLPDDVVVNSHANETGPRPGSSGNLSNEDKKTARLAAALNGPPESKEITASKKRVLDNKAEELMENAKTAKAKRIGEAMNNPQFEFLSDAQKQTVVSKWLASLD
jgi:hypothetical protein